MIFLDYCTDIDVYCPKLGYQRMPAYSCLLISQCGVVFTNVSIITLLLYSCKHFL